MPTLNWIGKDKIISHHSDVPFKVLKKKYTYNADKSDNMIINGDNLYALKSLLPRYEGRIDCVYIDPPYNTGKEKWVYNDNVNDPRILKWLGEVVGEESEDLTRHDKWLCMIYPRLQLLHKLLSEKGIIFISIDDNEYANLKLVLDEIFGRNNYCGTYFWKRTETPPSLSHKIRKKLEYIVCYQKTNIPMRKFAQGLTDGDDAPLLNSGNPLGRLFFKEGTVHFNIPDGIYSADSNKKIKLLNDVIVENGVNKYGFYAEGHFKWGQNNLNNEVSEGTYFLVKSKIFSIRYQKSQKSIKIPSNIIDSKVNVDTNETAKTELELLGFKDKISFEYAKPTSLIKYLIKMCFYYENKITILDCFAGSGTTGQAVLELNKEDGGERKFIEIEMMDYAETITAERIKKITSGFDGYSKINGDFSFYELGESIFLENGEINPNLLEEEVKQFIYFTETHSEVAVNNSDCYMGTIDSTAYYIFYKKNKIINLDAELLREIDIKADSYVIYADVCSLSEEFMVSHHIKFKKIPRDIQKI